MWVVICWEPTIEIVTKQSNFLVEFEIVGLSLVRNIIWKQSKIGKNGKDILSMLELNLVIASQGQFLMRSYKVSRKKCVAVFA